MKGISLN